MLGAFVMTLPTNLDYPIIAIADLHGQIEQLERLVAQLEVVTDWKTVHWSSWATTLIEVRMSLGRPTWCSNC
jgi:hypothetical protein